MNGAPRELQSQPVSDAVDSVDRRLELVALVRRQIEQVLAVRGGFDGRIRPQDRPLSHALDALTELEAELKP